MGKVNYYIIVQDISKRALLVATGSGSRPVLIYQIHRSYKRLEVRFTPSSFGQGAVARYLKEAELNGIYI